MLVECPAVPVPEDERLYISTAADAARSPAREDTNFELVTVKKCVTNYMIHDPPPAQGRTEKVNLYGVFAHDVQTDRYRERYSVRCQISTYFRGDLIAKRRESCEEVHERFMRHDRLPKEIRLEGEVSVADATAYLDYILDYDFDARAKEFVSSVMSNGGWLEAGMRNGKLVFRASFAHGGCATTGFETEATRDPDLKFHVLQDRSSIC